MKGERMEHAKQSLILLLKSLPINSSFNIISFGSAYKEMHKTSIKYTDENVEATINEI